MIKPLYYFESYPYYLTHEEAYQAALEVQAQLAVPSAWEVKVQASPELGKLPPGWCWGLQIPLDYNTWSWRYVTLAQNGECFAEREHVAFSCSYSDMPVQKLFGDTPQEAVDSFVVSISHLENIYKIITERISTPRQEPVAEPEPSEGIFWRGGQLWYRVPAQVERIPTDTEGNKLLQSLGPDPVKLIVATLGCTFREPKSKRE